jgi:hypothetical protein
MNRRRFKERRRLFFVAASNGQSLFFGKRQRFRNRPFRPAASAFLPLPPAPAAGLELNCEPGGVIL